MPAERPFEPRSRARRRALQALYQWRINPAPAKDIVRQFKVAQNFGNVDVAWFEALVAGVIESAEELDEHIDPFLDRSGAGVDVIERIILQIGAWELRNHTDIPYQVTLDEAVDLARRFGAEQGHEFVNAVLDRAARSWRADEYHRKSGSPPDRDG